MTERADRDGPGHGDDAPVLDRDQPAEPWPPEVLEEDEAGCE